MPVPTLMPRHCWNAPAAPGPTCRFPSFWPTRNMKRGSLRQRSRDGGKEDCPWICRRKLSRKGSAVQRNGSPLDARQNHIPRPRIRSLSHGFSIWPLPAMQILSTVLSRNHGLAKQFESKGDLKQDIHCETLFFNDSVIDHRKLPAGPGYGHYHPGG